ncbi:MAG TPA: hypothetical protein VFB36_09075 [Nevskiaceae bacterium]|nr:hypothetical protein [Nevskiaceae bacterium]
MLAAACAGFLLAVLWMDLMFDVQVLRHRDAVLPEPVLASIAAYYRRATTTSRPMGHLIAIVMLVLLAVSTMDALHTRTTLSWSKLALCATPIVLALTRIVPSAIRLGRRADSPELQSALARSICREHLFCFGALIVFLALDFASAASAP